MLSPWQDLAPKGWAERRPWFLSDPGGGKRCYPSHRGWQSQTAAALQPASSTEPGGKDVLGGEGLNRAANTCICRSLLGSPPGPSSGGSACSWGGRGTGAGVCRGRGQRFPSGCHCERSAQAGAGRCERVIASSSAGRLHHPDGWSEGSAPSRQPPGTRSRAGTRQGSASPAPANTATGGSWETSPVWVQRPAWLRQGCSRGHPSLGAARR